jgi:hypothetical protein
MTPNTQDSTSSGQEAAQKAKGSIQKLFALDKLNLLKKAQGCLYNNPEDCFAADMCQQCPENKNHG